MLVIIKISFGQDLRRIALREGSTFHEVSQQLKKLFCLPLSHSGLIISHILEEGKSEIIENDKDFQELVRQAGESKNKILRLEIQQPVYQTSSLLPQESQPVQSNPNILDREDVRKHLEAIIMETVQSKPFVDIISQKLNLYIEEKKNLEEEKQIQQVPIKEMEKPEQKEQALVPQPLELSLPQIKEESIPIVREEEPLVPEEEPVSDDESKEEPVEEGEEQLEEPDSFVVVPEENKQEKKSEGLSTSPLLKSVLSFFKSFKKEPKEVQEKTIPQDQLDQMLQQLNDMGFYDNEANTKALKFHYDFNEGLDAVLEDLLSQEIKPEEPEKQQEHVEMEKPKEKEVSNIVPQVENLRGINEVDIQKLMADAQISRETAVQALQSQLW